MAKGQEARRTDQCPVCKSKNITVGEKEDYNRFDHDSRSGNFTKYYIQWDCKNCGAKGNHSYNMTIAKVTVEE